MTNTDNSTPKTSLRFVKYTLIYILLVPFVNWTFTWFDPAVEGDAANGEKLYNSKCGACHGGRAWGNEALYTPRLTMLGDAYMIRQVTNFQAGMRGVDEEAEYGKQMAVMAKTVTAEELNEKYNRDLKGAELPMDTPVDPKTLEPIAAE